MLIANLSYLIFTPFPEHPFFAITICSCFFMNYFIAYLQGRITLFTLLFFFRVTYGVNSSGI